MFLVLVAIDSLGVKTSAALVGQTITELLGDKIEVTTMIVPERLTIQPAAVTEKLISITKPVDAVIFFERTIDHPKLWAARHRVLIPNPEWLTPHVAKSAARLTEIWHKTHVSLATLVECFPSLGHSYIGFTSRDLFGGDPDYNRFIHFKGKSTQKQTEIVLAAWRNHPEWPELSVQSYVDHPAFEDFPEWLQWRNVRIKYSLLSAEEYRSEVARGGVHLCPSSVEGFGHYLNEARSIGALVVTTDAAPMNELIDDTCGVLIAPVRTEKQNFGVRNIINLPDFEKAIQTVLAMPIEKRKALGANGRRRYLQERERFRAELTAQLGRLMRS